MPQIFIGGDSWGTGELPHLTHLGLEQYLREDGHAVFNTSTRGASNKDSISQLLETLKVHYQPEDHIFWIQSDPIRNLKLNPDTELLHNQLKNAGSINALMLETMHQDYSRLQSIARRFQTKINLIGGLVSINQDLANEFPRLNVFLQSWVKLMVGHLPEYANTDWTNFKLWTGVWTVDDLLLSKLNKDQTLCG